MSTPLTIAIAEPSAIIRYGLETVLKRIPSFRLHWVEITTPELINRVAEGATQLMIETLRIHKPNLLIINPILSGYFSLSQIKEETRCMDMKCAALLYTAIDPSLLKFYDEHISIYDTIEELRRKLTRLVIDDDSENEEQQALSAREKEILVCVVKGMTNREIADRLYLSTHTVVTHRRNITRKLQVHSVSGLTVYAIVNKLVELNDIKP